MLARIMDRKALWFFGAFGVLGLIVGLIVGLANKDGAGAILRALEAGILATLGGFMARSFILLLLAWGRDTPRVAFVVGWGFLLWPGLLETLCKFGIWFGRTVGRILGGPGGGAEAARSFRFFTRPAMLLWGAASVGCFTGMMDGVWRIHNWKGSGYIAFPLDVTWGLADSGNACLLHIVNFAWAGHPDEQGVEAHRYRSGFRLNGAFAFTQGSVMSNLDGNGPGAPLFVHERTHAWQNRLAGPLFVISYLVWMVLWFIPGLIVAGGQGIMGWCYFNDPWEVMAYAVAGQNRRAIAAATAGTNIWSDTAVWLVSIPYFGLLLLFYYFVFMKTWWRPR